MDDRSYDPSWVVELAKQQYPEDVRLHEALALCTAVERYCSCGCGTPYFVGLSSESAAEDSEFGIRIPLEREGKPAVVVDLLSDGRVACIDMEG